MTGTVCLRNRQRVCAVDLRLLRRILHYLLQEQFRPAKAELCFHLVAALEMTAMNEYFLGHAGSTDVITFDYADNPRQESLEGEIYICLDEARRQARRYHTSWQSELVRYAIHGLLHLRGFDDSKPGSRLAMKRAEGRLLKSVANAFSIPSLRRKPAA